MYMIRTYIHTSTVYKKITHFRISVHTHSHSQCSHSSTTVCHGVIRILNTQAYSKTSAAADLHNKPQQEAHAHSLTHALIADCTDRVAVESGLTTCSHPEQCVV